MEMKARMYKVMTPVERKDGSTFWMRVGTAFPAKNDSSAINVYLDAYPRDAKAMLHVREMDEEDLQRSASRRGQRGDGASVPAREDLPF